MRTTDTITSPSSYVSEPYTPGHSIDAIHPAGKSDLDTERVGIRTSLLEAGNDAETLITLADEWMFQMHMVESRNNVRTCILQYAQTADAASALDHVYANYIGTEQLSSAEKILRLLEATDVLTKPPHHPVTTYSHIPGERTELQKTGTHFGYALDGKNTLTYQGDTYPLQEGRYFSVPGEGAIEGTGRVQIITRIGVQGIFSIGGPVESWGRLQYINGCTDTVLIPPAKMGDPVLNALFIPPYIDQTQYTHPSIRTGIVASGHGLFRAPRQESPLEPGTVFFLPSETYHSFHTQEADSAEQSALTVIVFHPDSDTGPTDENHAMKNRTYFDFDHRLKSLKRLSQQ